MYNSANATMKVAPVVKNLTKFMDIKSLQKLDSYATFNPSPLSVAQLIELGRSADEAKAFKFLRREIPVRMANVMKEITLLPSNLLAMPSVLTIQEWYAASFRELIEFEKAGTDRSSMDQFLSALTAVLNRHNHGVQTMALGVLELKEHFHVDHSTEMSIQYFLDRYYMNRISLRMLMNQHVTLFEDGINTRKLVGMISTVLNVKKVIEADYAKAATQCETFYGRGKCPGIRIVEHNAVNPGKPILITYPELNLRHIFVELLKNSMRAVIENNSSVANDQSAAPKTAAVPCINVLITKGATNITIKISDQGGGISRDATDELFLYLYSTAPRPDLRDKKPDKVPFAGYGYGLPLSRLYARYFHGDLVLNSCEGYGTDATVFLRSDPDNAIEVLPVFNRTSTKQYKSSLPAADWTDPYSSMNRQYHPHYLLGGRIPNSNNAASSTPPAAE